MNTFTWVKTHHEIVEYLRTQRNNQPHLVEILRKVGINGLHDENKIGERIDLKVIDPFTFFCFIYKYGSEKRLKVLQDIAKELKLTIPTDEFGIPSVNALMVCLFPYEGSRTNNEINRLWDFFESALNDTISDEKFEDILTIFGTGKSKITSCLFNILPEKHFPINGPTKPYLQEVLGINPEFETYSDYIEILNNLKQKENKPYYQLSYDAWKWNDELSKANYWIFQGNPSIYNVVEALNDGLLNTWNIKAHEDKIKIGDRIILWITGNSAGCYALGEVTSDIYEGVDSEEQNRYYLDKSKNTSAKRVKIKVAKNLVDNPITKKEIEKVPELKDLKVGLQGTNFTATKEEYQVLLDMAKEKSSINYWVYSPGEQADMWEEFYKKGIMGLGWDNLDDLTKYKSKDSIATKLIRINKSSTNENNNATTNFSFANELNIGDIVFAKKGRKELIGYGVVKSDYYFDDKRNTYKSCRKVEWRKKGNWEIDFSLALKTLTNITKYKSENSDYDTFYELLLGIINGTKNTGMQHDKNLALNTILYGPPGTGKTYSTIKKAVSIANPEFNLDLERPALKSEYERLVNEGQIVFTTFHQSLSYEDFIEGIKPLKPNADDSFIKYDVLPGLFMKVCDDALSNFENAKLNNQTKLRFEIVFEKLQEDWEENSEMKFPLKKDGFEYTIIGFTNSSIQFKKANGGTGHTLSIRKLRELYYGSPYDFNIGIGIYYPGILSKLNSYSNSNSIQQSNGSKQPLIKNFVLIIDEINRGNVSQIFGELITLLEEDKRLGKAEALELMLPYSKVKFGVPPNLYLIGTMNTADRSVEALDTALRRRFAFEEITPNYDRDIIDYSYAGINASDILKTINNRIEKLLDKDHLIGHSYFIKQNHEQSKDKLINTFYKNIIPLLQEYFFGDYGKIGLILGQGFVILKEWDNNADSFAHFNYDGSSDYDHKEVYQIVDYRSSQSYFVNNVKMDFEKAIKLLMKINIA